MIDKPKIGQVWGTNPDYCCETRIIRDVTTEGVDSRTLCSLNNGFMPWSKWNEWINSGHYSRANEMHRLLGYWNARTGTIVAVAQQTG